MSVLDAAIRRAGSHDWVVSIPMPVAISIVVDETGVPIVGNVVPRGMPAIDSIGAITCRACGAGDFTFDCPGPDGLADEAEWRQAREFRSDERELMPWDGLPS